LENYLTVTRLNTYIKRILEENKHLTFLLIKGEISNFKRHSRGHLYFTLKDESSQISAIMFSGHASTLTFEPKEGDHVLIEGKISLYLPSGSYSIQVTQMKLDGIGELYLKYEALKNDLALKGFFKEEHKKKIPKYPKKIGVITSPTGAVIQDIKNTINRRYTLTEIHLYPALVQGLGSADSIKNQIEYANRLNEVDVLIVGRGGGSIEDLWSFNEEKVILAIFNSKIPIITAIGHETDYTISDFVSDLRAPTPTAAAELATPNKVDLIQKIAELKVSIQKQLYDKMELMKTNLVYIDRRLDQFSPIEKINRRKQEVENLNEQLYYKYNQYMLLKTERLNFLNKQIKSPLDRIERLKEKTEQFDKKLNEQIKTILQNKYYKVDIFSSTLNGNDPLKTIRKGFAVIEKEGQIIDSITKINLNDQIQIKFFDGQVDAKIVNKKKE
jgi:exodeoxyribonuclease VII large subunit